MTPTPTRKKPFKHTRLILGGATLSLLIGAALLAPLLTKYPPGIMDISQRLLPPSSHHWLGTDLKGIDLWTSLLFGARQSLFISSASVLISTLLGTCLGLIAGYYGKFWEQVIMRTIDVLVAFPGILLPLILCTLVPPSFMTLVFTLSITGWIGPARLVRGEILSLKQREFVTAAHAIGASPSSVLFKHLFPHVLPILLTQMTLSFSSVIIIESSLSFLGLGPRTQVPSWGELLSDGRTVMGQSPLLALAPGLALFLVIVSVNLITDSLRSQNERRF